MAQLKEGRLPEDWVVKLENKHKKHHRLAHEIGAGSPCLVCGDKCPGLDLHFWRKVCRNCKCKKDDHDVEDDDMCHFEIVFGHKVKQQITVLELKLNIGKDAQECTKKVVKLDWAPPNISPDMASEYMEKLPKINVPLCGSSGALYRKQQIQRQIPLHDFDPALCHDLTQNEIKNLEIYAANVRKNAVGQAQVVRTPISKWLISSTANTLQKSFNSSQLKDSDLRSSHKNNEFGTINKTASNVDNCCIYSKEGGLEQSVELNNLQPMFAQLLKNEGKNKNVGPHDGVSSIFPNGNTNTGFHNTSNPNHNFNQTNFGDNLDMSKDVSSLNPNRLDTAKGGNSNKLADMELNNASNPNKNTDGVNIKKSLGTSKELNSPFSLHTSPLKKDLSKFSNINLKGDDRSSLPYENTNMGLHNTSSPNHNFGQRNFGTDFEEGTNSYSMHPDNSKGGSKHIYSSSLRGDDPSTTTYENANIGPNNTSSPNCKFGQRNFGTDFEEDTNSSHSMNSDNTKGGSKHIYSNSLRGDDCPTTPYENVNVGLNTSSPNRNLGQRNFGRDFDKGPNSSLTTPNKTIGGSKNSNSLKGGDNSTPYENANTDPHNTSSPNHNYGQRNFGTDFEEGANSSLPMNPDNIKGGNKIIYSDKTQHDPVYVKMHTSNVVTAYSEGLNNQAVGYSKSLINDNVKHHRDMKPYQYNVVTNQGSQDHNKGNMELVEELIDCAECKNVMEAGSIGVVVSKGSDTLLWHPECFVCTTCKELLVDLLYFYHKGKVYCGRDYAAINNIPRCYACDELIFVNKYTQAEGHSFHLKHFCCSECDILLADKKYTLINELPVCLECYNIVYAKVCGTCKNIVSLLERSVCLHDLKWHATDACFICHYCLKSLLNSKFVIKNKNPFCNKDCVIASGLVS